MPDLRTEAFVNGEWRNAKNGASFPVFNPATGEKLADVTDCDGHDAEQAISAAKEAFCCWSKVSPKDRASCLEKIHDRLIEHRKSLAELMTRENGKPLSESLAEVGFTASFFAWFCGESRRMYGDYVPSPVPGKEMIHIRQPMGVAAMITPWNFPLGMIGRKMAAALAAGCTCVLKPAHDTPLIALAFMDIITDCLPCKGIVNVLPSSHENACSIGEVFCTHPDVSVVSFTGSTTVGKWLYNKSSSTVKHLSLELGGNAPFIVFPSANLELAVEGAMISKFRNAGQTCVTPNRFFIHSTILDKFVSCLKNKMENDLKAGNGLEDDVNLGPLINQKQHEKVTSLVKSAQKDGCKLHLGGPDPHPLGKTYFNPTLFTSCNNNMEIAQEEIFGPVVVVIPFDNEEEVIKMANASNRGLAGYFYSENVSQIWRVAKSLQVGMVGINEPMVSTCEAAFGGVKESGIGIEGSKYGLNEFSTLKYVCFGNLTGNSC